jgi:NAD(P)-dependent dehydrogenase (short-subunit alcohol dehydrogenase family)
LITDFHGKCAVLTGAGSGFGLECARIAARLGMSVVLVDVQADALEQADAELRTTGADVLSRRTDVASAADMEALAHAVQDRFGAPHFVFNNAGVGAGGLVWENSVADWEWVLGVNLWGVIHGVRLFTPMMLAAAKADASWQGHIVNTASMAGLLAPPNMGVYNTGKHAVVGLTETLYQDLRLVTTQVGASVLCPHFVPTAITRSQMIGEAMGEQAVRSGRVSAADVAQMVFDAVAQDRFYIYSHPKGMGAVRARVEAIVHGTNPADPFGERPELGEQLRAALRDG